MYHAYLYDRLVNTLARLDWEISEIQKDRFRKRNERFWSSIQ